MRRLLILEDNVKDACLALEIAQRAGFEEITAHTSSKLVQMQLENSIEANRPLPDVLLVDLDLGFESGFELLRFLHRNRLMSRTRIVVWTVMGDKEREICRLFKVEHFVSKYDGPKCLLEVLTRINGAEAKAV